MWRGRHLLARGTRRGHIGALSGWNHRVPGQSETRGLKQGAGA
jgi:hypothetical protein